MFESRGIEVGSEDVDMLAIVSDVIASLKLQTEKMHASIELKTEGNLHLTGDQFHLQSLVFNLLDNALKYSGENASVVVTLNEQPDKIVLSVADNGIGIPIAYRKKVFEKFFRVPAGNTHNSKGHGLGLSYVAEVVHEHHGQITLDSKEGTGSTFTILLPKTQHR